MSWFELFYVHGHKEPVMRDILEDAADQYAEALPILLVSTAGGIVAGTVLSGDGMQQAFATIPGLLLMLPAMLATRGNIYGSLGARIGTALHQGLIEPRFTVQRRLLVAIAAAFINGLSVAVFVAGSSKILLLLMGWPSAPFVTLLFVTVLAAMMSAVVMSGLLVVLLFTGYRHELNPDVLTGPIVTTAGDIFGVLFIYIAVILAGVVL